MATRESLCTAMKTQHSQNEIKTTTKNKCHLLRMAFPYHPILNNLILALTGASQVVLMVKNPPANVGHARDMGSIPGLGRTPGVGNGNPLQHFCLENSMGRGAW